MVKNIIIGLLIILLSIPFYTPRRAFTLSLKNVEFNDSWDIQAKLINTSKYPIKMTLQDKKATDEYFITQALPNETTKATMNIIGNKDNIEEVKFIITVSVPKPSL